MKWDEKFYRKYVQENFTDKKGGLKIFVVDFITKNPGYISTSERFFFADYSKEELETKIKEVDKKFREFEDKGYGSFILQKIKDQIKNHCQIEDVILREADSEEAFDFLFRAGNPCRDEPEVVARKDTKKITHPGFIRSQDGSCEPIHYMQYRDE